MGNLVGNLFGNVLLLLFGLIPNFIIKSISSKQPINPEPAWESWPKYVVAS
jgi:hypothetical protein